MIARTGASAGRDLRSRSSPLKSRLGASWRLPAVLASLFSATVASADWRAPTDGGVDPPAPWWLTAGPPIDLGEARPSLPYRRCAPDAPICVHTRDRLD